MPERNDSDEPCPTPSPPQTESPTDSEPPQAESLEPDRPAEAVNHLSQPVREVNLLLSSACSFQLFLACLYRALTWVNMRIDLVEAHSDFLNLTFSAPILWCYCTAITNLLQCKFSLLVPFLIESGGVLRMRNPQACSNQPFYVLSEN